jgi:hypothetical protein
MARTSGTKLVSLVDLVHLFVSFSQPNKRDQPNKPNRRGIRPGGVLEVCGGRVRDRMGRR